MAALRVPSSPHFPPFSPPPPLLSLPSAAAPPPRGGAARPRRVRAGGGRRRVAHGGRGGGTGAGGKGGEKLWADGRWQGDGFPPAPLDNAQSRQGKKPRPAEGEGVGITLSRVARYLLRVLLRRQQGLDAALVAVHDAPLINR